MEADRAAAGGAMGMLSSLSNVVQSTVSTNIAMQILFSVTYNKLFICLLERWNWHNSGKDPACSFRDLCL